MKAKEVKFPEIRVEDFLVYYNRAYKRQNIGALNQLHDLYPEAAVWHLMINISAAVVTQQMRNTATDIQLRLTARA